MKENILSLAPLFSCLLFVAITYPSSIHLQGTDDVSDSLGTSYREPRHASDNALT
jgi:hypothetical protein